MWWEEVECEGEVRRWEDGEGLDEDVGDGLIFGEVGVELVSVAESIESVICLMDVRTVTKVELLDVFQIELIINFKRQKGFILHCPQVIENVYKRSSLDT